MHYLIITEFDWKNVHEDTYSWCIYKVDNFFSDLDHLLAVLKKEVVQVFIAEDYALEFKSYEDDIMPYMRIIEINEENRFFLTNSLGSEKGLCSFMDIIASSIQIPCF